MLINHRSYLFIIGVLWSIPLFAQDRVYNDKFELSNERDKISYALGLMIAENHMQEYGNLNYHAFFTAMFDRHKERDTLISVSEAVDLLNDHLKATSSRDKQVAELRGKEYFDQNSIKAGIETTKSGLQYEILSEGSGPKPAANDRVVVHFRGTLIDGTEFDDSYSKGGPSTYQLDQVIVDGKKDCD